MSRLRVLAWARSIYGAANPLISRQPRRLLRNCDLINDIAGGALRLWAPVAFPVGALAAVRFRLGRGGVIWLWSAAEGKH